MIDRDDSSVRFALIDVELLVSSGAPRSAFQVVPESEESGSPRFEVSSSILAARNRRLDESAEFVEDQPAHPYDLGPLWHGNGCWTADFGVDDRGMTRSALVHHRWCPVDHSPIRFPDFVEPQVYWRWAYISGSQAVYGSADTPRAAADAAENARDLQLPFRE